MRIFFSNTLGAIVKENREREREEKRPSIARTRLIMTDIAFSLLEVQQMVRFVIQLSSYRGQFT